MIIHSYDTSEPLITPASFGGEQGHFCDVCLVTFSHVIHSHLLETFDCEQIAELKGADGVRPIHRISYKGRDVAFYLSNLGSTLAATNVIEVNWLVGATKFVMFGSAGSLDRAATEGKYVIPTEAYRDEGMSYHYAPPADYIRIKNSDTVSRIFAELGVPQVSGRVWTTDAFYRETRDQLAARQKEGCIAVEMEAAGVQAVCDFHGWELFNFLVTGDVLDDMVWQIAGLSGANHDLDKLCLALELAARI